MGITAHSNDIVQRYKDTGNKMLELGSQNTYFAPVFTDGVNWFNAKDYYTAQGFEHRSLDANGEYGSEVVDLSKDLGLKPEYDIVTDFGTSEHVEHYYNCWLNKHNGCRVGGVIISENPKVGNWPGHGFHYVTEEFYTKLAYLAGYEILELGEHPAMGNTTDGWNVYCVLRKTKDKFISEDKFYGLPFESSKPKQAQKVDHLISKENFDQIIDKYGVKEGQEVNNDLEYIEDPLGTDILADLKDQYSQLDKRSKQAKELKKQIKKLEGGK